MDEMPKVLGAEPCRNGTDERAWWSYCTAIGLVYVVRGEYGYVARWFPWLAMMLELPWGDTPKDAAAEADRRLRALLAAAVEPIAAKLEADSYELHGRFAAVEIAAAERAANLVRTFYAKEPSR
jgi:hypothetical protein